MISVPKYKVNLYLNGTLIGDCRYLARNLTYTRKRTKAGVDSISFTVNDVLFDRWCQEYGYTINDLLKPIALECRIVRNNVEVVGGFLATMPAYQPLKASADLSMAFDGYLNLLNGVFIRDRSTNLPLGTLTGNAGPMVSTMISMADDVARAAGKRFGFTAGTVENLSSITQTFDNYKTVKDWICDRCDNATGAGQFDVYFHANKTYDIKASSRFGDDITDWIAYYPTMLNNTSATSISAAEIGGFSSAVIGLGSGEVSANADENTALYRFTSNRNKVIEYGYVEEMYQESSISQAATMDKKIASILAANSNPIWQPEITLHGKQVAPTPSGEKKIWLGDKITIENKQDLTGMTNGKFKVNELTVSITAAGDETITPVLERV